MGEIPPTGMADEGALVIDNGGYTLKLGYAGEDAPRVCLPNCEGVPKVKGCTGGAPAPTARYYGDEAQCKRGILNMTYPIERRNIINWEAMENIWRHAIDNELPGSWVGPTDVLLTEPPPNGKEPRE